VDPVPAPRASVVREAAEGVRWLAGHRVVGALALLGGLASVGYMLPFSVLVLFARDRLGLDAAGYGVLLAASALGGLAGSAIAAPLRARIGARWTIVAALALGAASLAGLAVTRDPVVAGVLLALYILHAVVWGICATSLRQRLVPDPLLGRVGAAGRALSLLGLAVGSALGGVLATVDIAVPTVAGAAVFAGCALLAVLRLRGSGSTAP
jgi:predicted MFS family arabinose efflux permease